MTISEQLTAKRQASALRHARSAASGRMVDLVRVERSTNRVWNRDTGDYESGDVTVVYAGKARLTQGSGAEADSGTRPVSTGAYVLLLPWDVEDVSVSDVAVMLNETGDELRRFNVADVDHSSSRKALRVSVTHVDPGTVTYG